ncbi:MAG: NADP-dependent malic enzyme [Clostridia bacterium]|nr:NADP-dependent malic enzyme [Clostridia bacterium]
MSIGEESLKKHYEWNGKIEMVARCRLDSKEDLSLAYTPGVAAACLKIKEDPDEVYRLTRRSNLVAVITDGSAVLGLGDIGHIAGMPVMEGKCALLKEFGGVDAIPLCVSTKDVDEFVNTVYRISDSFGGINLEDISAPRCFEIEAKLREKCRIPVFHDDQHGTAVVVCAALINACKLTSKDMKNIKVAVSGAGAAGTAIAKMLYSFGVHDITMCDIDGILTKSRVFRSKSEEELANMTNPLQTEGTIKDAVKGADVFIGVSAPNVLSADMVKSMNKDSIVFAMANPTPEIMPSEAYAAGAAIVGTGRSDFDNQINNVLAFPGIFKGALMCRASDINDEMKIAAAKAIANMIDEGELSRTNIVPSALDKCAADAVAKAVANAARLSGVARV